MLDINPLSGVIIPTLWAREIAQFRLFNVVEFEHFDSTCTQFGCGREDT